MFELQRRADAVTVTTASVFQVRGIRYLRNYVAFFCRHGRRKTRARPFRKTTETRDRRDEPRPALTALPLARLTRLNERISPAENSNGRLSDKMITVDVRPSPPMQLGPRTLFIDRSRRSFGSKSRQKCTVHGRGYLTFWKNVSVLRRPNGTRIVRLRRIGSQRYNSVAPSGRRTRASALKLPRKLRLVSRNNRTVFFVTVRAGTYFLLSRLESWSVSKKCSWWFFQRTNIRFG